MAHDAQFDLNATRQRRALLKAGAALALASTAGLAALPARANDLKLGQPAPPLVLKTLDGRSIATQDLKGQVVIATFWATWCAPCRREIPLLEGLSGHWGDRGVQIVGIAVDHRDAVVNYARELRIEYPILIGEQDALDVAASLGFESPVFPFTVFTDRRGEVVALYVGELHQPQADFILSVVQNLNQEHLELKEARRTIAEGLLKIAPGKPG